MCSIKQFLVYPIYIHCNTIFTILCNQNVEEVDIDLKYLCFFFISFFYDELKPSLTLIGYDSWFMAKLTIIWRHH